MLQIFSNSTMSKLCTYVKYICSKLKTDFSKCFFPQYFCVEPILTNIDLVFLYNN